MSDAHQRGLLLLQQGRYDLADREFRRSLSQSPDDPLAHAFLSLCLNRTDKHDDALAEADEAVRCGPNLAFCHYVRGCALQGKKRLADAEAAAIEAIQLDPEDADYPALLASIAMERRDWKGALEAANRGLALDPEQNACLNLRAMALVQLGRRVEAAETLGSALADDPENALTHANQGWALLHQRDHVKALEHFREALRIDPDLDWARSGIVEALKARFLVYRVMLSFFLWMGRQSSIMQWAVILGFVVGPQLLERLAKANPALQPFITPLLIVSITFVVMTWIASPLFNLTLRFNKFGRLALTDDERKQSNWIGGCFFLAMTSALFYLVTGNVLGILPMGFFGFLLLPLAVTFRQRAGNARRIGALYTLGMAAIGLTSLTMLVLNIKLLFGFSWSDLAIGFIWAAPLSTWLNALLGSGRFKR